MQTPSPEDFHDEYGIHWIWDNATRSYQQATHLEQNTFDQATGGDANNLFATDQNPLGTWEKTKNPMDEGIMARVGAAPWEKKYIPQQRAKWGGIVDMAVEMFEDQIYKGYEVDDILQNVFDWIEAEQGMSITTSSEIVNAIEADYKQAVADATGLPVNEPQQPAGGGYSLDEDGRGLVDTQNNIERMIYNASLHEADYNGYENWETNEVDDWINNDEYTQGEFRELAARTDDPEEFQALFESMHPEVYQMWAELIPEPGYPDIVDWTAIMNSVKADLKENQEFMDTPNQWSEKVPLNMPQPPQPGEAEDMIRGASAEQPALQVGERVELISPNGQVPPNPHLDPAYKAWYDSYYGIKGTITNMAINNGHFLYKVDFDIGEQETGSELWFGEDCLKPEGFMDQTAEGTTVPQSFDPQYQVQQPGEPEDMIRGASIGNSDESWETNMRSNPSIMPYAYQAVERAMNRGNAGEFDIVGTAAAYLEEYGFNAKEAYDNAELAYARFMDQFDFLNIQQKGQDQPMFEPHQNMPYDPLAEQHHSSLENGHPPDCPCEQCEFAREMEKQQEVHHQWAPFAEREPHRNRMNYDDSFPSMMSTSKNAARPIEVPIKCPYCTLNGQTGESGCTCGYLRDLEMRKREQEMDPKTAAGEFEDGKFEVGKYDRGGKYPHDYTGPYELSDSSTFTCPGCGQPLDETHGVTQNELHPNDSLPPVSFKWDCPTTPAKGWEYNGKLVRKDDQQRFTGEDGERYVHCSCGNDVGLWSGWANQCEQCQREYNGSGQELAPRSQWGEETGEDFSDPEVNYDMQWGTAFDPSIRGKLPKVPRRDPTQDFLGKTAASPWDFTPGTRVVVKQWEGYTGEAGTVVGLTHPSERGVDMDPNDMASRIVEVKLDSGETKSFQWSYLEPVPDAPAEYLSKTAEYTNTTQTPEPVDIWHSEEFQNPQHVAWMVDPHSGQPVLSAPNAGHGSLPEYTQALQTTGGDRFDERFPVGEFNNGRLTYHRGDDPRLDSQLAQAYQNHRQQYPQLPPLNIRGLRTMPNDNPAVPNLKLLGSEMNPDEIRKPHEWRHFHDRLAWEDSQPDLSSCPDCASPMTDRKGESFCSSCGNRQPHIYAQRQGGLVGDLAGAAGTGALMAAPWLLGPEVGAPVDAALMGGEASGLGGAAAAGAGAMAPGLVGGLMNSVMGGGGGGGQPPEQMQYEPGTVAHTSASDDEVGLAVKDDGQDVNPNIHSTDGNTNLDGDDPSHTKDHEIGTSSEGIQALQQTLQEVMDHILGLADPSVSGENDPIAKALDELLEAHTPGYRGDRGGDGFAVVLDADPDSSAAEGSESSEKPEGDSKEAKTAMGDPQSELRQAINSWMAGEMDEQTFMAVLQNLKSGLGNTQPVSVPGEEYMDDGMDWGGNGRMANLPMAPAQPGGSVPAAQQGNATEVGGPCELCGGAHDMSMHGVATDNTMHAVASQRTGRRPKMCPFHSDLVDYSLTLGDPHMALQSITPQAYGRSWCKHHSYDSKCNFKPQMVKQEYWDQHNQELDQRRLERQQQDALYEQQEAPVSQDAEVSMDTDSTDMGGYSPSEIEGVSAVGAPAMASVKQSWIDNAGNPLTVGQHYKMKSPKFGVPEDVEITDVGPNKIGILVNSDLGIQYRDEVSPEQLMSYNYNFDHDPRPEVDHSEFTPETNNEYPFYDDPGGQNDMSDQPIHSIEQGEFEGVDAATLARVAGKNYTMDEQASFINEAGVARNLESMDLSATHYGPLDHYLHDIDSETSLW